ncbi:hypothetical protein TNCV_2562101 [Trichonephila clavipes]|uniref:Uncharacterized protein n=1 Tax=Trichonephila clavipes TaxID=2585209 RepID=A0A8X6UWM0_TRICX|nr:hypothetical protein TNCV_2562101 [Trichonephila clavipes]
MVNYSNYFPKLSPSNCALNKNAALLRYEREYKLFSLGEVAEWLWFRTHGWLCRIAGSDEVYRDSKFLVCNKLLLYTAVLCPILTYGLPVWGYTADANIKILEIAQNSLCHQPIVAGPFSSLQDIPAETEKTNIVPVAPPPCDDQTTNQDTLSQAGPFTSAHIDKLDMG